MEKREVMVMEAYGCLSCYFGLLDGIYGNPSFTLEDAQLFICARDAEAQNLRTAGLAAGAIELTATGLLVERVVRRRMQESGVDSAAAC